MKSVSVAAYALLSTLLVAHGLQAQEPTKSLVEMGEASQGKLEPSSDQVKAVAANDGISVTIAPGNEGYPGVKINPSSPWDLSAFGHVEAKITNTGTKAVNVSLRVDNDGDWKNNPFNAESTTIQPGKTGTVSVIFGYSYGKKPGYKLKPEAVARLLIFAGKASVEQSFRIDSIVAAGPAGEKPPVDPNSIRIVPEKGVIFGTGVKIDTEKQLNAKDVKVTPSATGLQVAFPKGATDPRFGFKPVQGRWDLRQLFQVRVRIKNDGQAAVTPRVRVDSDRGPAQTVTAAAPIEPGASADVVVPFASATVWEGVESSTKNMWEGKPNTGTKFGSDAVKEITVALEKGTADRSIVIESITAEMPPAPAMPDWLGKRPPVEGEWTKTFEDNFDGSQIDLTKWNIYGENYWDKKSHFSKDNVIVGDGVAKLRFEKKSGPHNDDPSHKRGVTEYATGFLETYGKWVQRYGYFESRMKLPSAPGLWPAFWLMPDRGVEVGEQWKRADTRKGGMEFDIMEHLTRWGPARYNVAFHWDGYEKDHKSTGSEAVYFQPDKDGFITAGLLWTPGLAVYYANGVEVARWENPRISTIQSQIMFTLPHGGWDNSPIDESMLPNDFVIDYVRVWQRKDLVSDVDGPQGAAKK